MAEIGLAVSLSLLIWANVLCLSGALRGSNESFKSWANLLLGILFTAWLISVLRALAGTGG